MTFVLGLGCTGHWGSGSTESGGLVCGGSVKGQRVLWFRVEGIATYVCAISVPRGPEVCTSGCARGVGFLGSPKPDS